MEGGVGWGSASRWIEVVIKHTTCKNDPKLERMGKKGTRRGTRGNGKVDGDARDSHHSHSQNRK